ncbi:MAG: YigZ family protein [Clostridia bacterium]|nr:YigZ family protein [Clostridia bacterium]
MKNEYRTVLKSAVVEYEEKKSRFIASVKPINTEDEALGFISALKSKYWDATHNVYAYYIADNNSIQRFSDDGEPSGTAGIPVLEVIKRKGVRNIVVVITRYFGGTLLGAAGLIRAYGKSAAMGIDAAEVIRRQLCKVVNVVIEYTLFGKLQSFLISKGYIIKDVIYTQDVEIILYIPVEQVETVMEEIHEVTNTRSVVEAGENVYITLSEEGKLING